MKELLLLALSVSFTVSSYLSLESLRVKSTESVQEETLYLPNGQALQFMSFGYQHALGQLLWFKTINYFGKHYQRDRNYRWLAHMCGLVTALNPALTHTYQFCATMLTWEANNVEASNQILSQAIEQHPRNWFFWYLRGFNYAFFLRDEQKAKDDFVSASRLPGAHPAVIRLAGKKLLNLSSPDTAINFLNEMIESTADPKARSALRERLQEAQYEKDLRALERAADLYYSRLHVRATDIHELARENLVPSELVEQHFRDPFGGFYSLDSVTGEVRSSSGKKRPTLYWNRS